MKSYIVVLVTLFASLFSISSFAAGTRLGDILRPSKEYCFVFTQKVTGETDRKEIRFELENVRSRFEKTEVIDDEVEFYLSVTQQDYVMALYKRTDTKHERPLARGIYNRTGRELDFNTNGFDVYTPNVEYSAACVTEQLL